MPQGRGLYTDVLPSFFRALGNLLFRFPDAFFSSLCYELVSLSGHAVIGILFLRFFIRLPRLLEIVAGIFTGIGITTFILEVWAIFFLLNPFTVCLTFIGIVVFFLLLKRRYGFTGDGPDFEVAISENRFQRGIYYAAFFCLAVITALSFYHALFFPVDYWDSLIYYVHYGKMTYQQGGFPILVCLQVGLGLGANYPHLFPLHQAVTATLFGQWSDLYGQFLCPLAGLGTVIVIYYLALHLFRDRLTAILSALAFRSVPFVTSYIIWASDYALVMMYTALFLLFAAWLLRETTLRSVQPFLCIAAVFPHINYLGWIVWPCVVLGIVYARSTLFQKKRSGITIGTLFFWFLLGLTWYIRNWLVTGNPVYAFFPTIFGGENINLDVLKSCENEWLLHGNGVANWGETLWERIANSPSFFLFRVWQFAPVFMGIMVPGFLLWWKRGHKFFYLSGLLILLYLFYEYVISGFYLYHIIAIFPILSLFAGRFLAVMRGTCLFSPFGVLLVCMGVLPGILYSIIGPKTDNPSLPFFAFPGLERETFYKIRFPEAASVWFVINRDVEHGAGILSHDNRYHVFRDDIRIVHLDDCDITPLYGKPYPEIHHDLLSRGIRYYFYIADELTHPITQQLGHWSYVNDPRFFELIATSPAKGNPAAQAKLYRLIESNP
ncbi:MAG: hypothetical protein C4527_05395 [Candidatus Omnitrophota bacterium]|jgi:hypothetical protein|nr:MAG: hypothetical protein C4527_05395 [Candidatus Omnitrophota bacterium]